MPPSTLTRVFHGLERLAASGHQEPWSHVLERHLVALRRPGLEDDCAAAVEVFNRAGASAFRILARALFAVKDRTAFLASAREQLAGVSLGDDVDPFSFIAGHQAVERRFAELAPALRALPEIRAMKIALDGLTREGEWRPPVFTLLAELPFTPTGKLMEAVVAASIATRRAGLEQAALEAFVVDAIRLVPKDAPRDSLLVMRVLESLGRKVTHAALAGGDLGFNSAGGVLALEIDRYRAAEQGRIAADRYFDNSSGD